MTVVETERLIYVKSKEDLEKIRNMRVTIVTPQGEVLGSTYVSHVLSDKVKRILVNGRPKAVDNRAISHEELVDLSESKRKSLHTISFSHGPIGHEQGTLRPGQSVEVQDGMVFDVGVTDNA